VSKDIVRAADAAQYARPAIPEDQRGQIRVRLLNATPDPLGSIAALCEQYKGNVIRSLSEVNDEQRRQVLDDMSATVLNGPLEAAQFHWQIEGVTRSITHQMVRSRASFFAQESLRFAVPEGDWSAEVPYPPSLAKPADGRYSQGIEMGRVAWQEAMKAAQESYEDLINLGVPAEEARGVLPHDIPTRIHWVCDLRTMLAEAGKRTCTQAQFPWRLIFAGMAKALRDYRTPYGDGRTVDNWQFSLIAGKLRPDCYQKGKCTFMAEFDRSCNIRERVEANAATGRPSSEWGEDGEDSRGYGIRAINTWEWAADPSAARS
jgi:flavin-dependent thymidylate synthase